MLAQGPLGAPVFVALSAHEQESAEFVVLGGLSGDARVTAVVAFLADEAYWTAAAGLVHEVHPFGELPFGSVDKGSPFGWTHEDPPTDLLYEVLPFDSLVEDHPSGLGHVDHPSGLGQMDPPSGSGHVGHPSPLGHGDHPWKPAHGDHPYRMIC